MSNGKTIEISKGFTGYLSRPEGGTGPGLLIYHAVFGVNDVLRAVADSYAAKGYVVLCPDMFWRQEPGVELSESKEADVMHGLELFRAFDMEKGKGDLATALSTLRAHDACNGKVGCLGFCFGGRMAYMMAAHTDVDVAVSYYGTAIENHLDDAPKVGRPLMLHLAGRDRFVPKEAQDAISGALGGNPAVQIFVYEDMDHAFAREGSSGYDQTNADLANARTEAFLAEALL